MKEETADGFAVTRRSFVVYILAWYSTLRVNLERATVLDYIVLRGGGAYIATIHCWRLGRWRGG